MQRKKLTLITTICTVIVSALIAVAVLLFVVPFQSLKRVDAADANKLEIATAQDADGNVVYDVNYNKDWNAVGFRIAADSTGVVGGYFTSYVRAVDANGTSLSGVYGFFVNDYVFITTTDISQGNTPPLNSVYTIEAGFTYTTESGTQYVATTDISFVYATEGASLVEAVNWLIPEGGNNTLTLYTPAATDATPTTDTTTWELYKLYTNTQVTGVALDSCTIANTSVATVTYSGLDVTITAVATGTTKLHVTYQHVNVDLTVNVIAPDLKISRVDYSDDWQSAVMGTNMNSLDDYPTSDGLDGLSAEQISYISYVNIKGEDALKTVHYLGTSILLNYGTAPSVGDVVTVRKGFVWVQGSTLQEDVSFTCTASDGTWTAIENPTLTVQDTYVMPVVTDSTGEHGGFGYMIHFNETESPFAEGSSYGTYGTMPTTATDDITLVDSSGNDIKSTYGWIYHSNYIFGVANDVDNYEIGSVITLKAGFTYFGYVLQEDVSYICKEFGAQMKEYDPSTDAPTGVSASGTSNALGCRVGQNTAQITATVSPSTAITTVKYSTNNPSVATVDSTGLVTAVAKGTAVITVKAGQKSTTYTVTVSHNLVIKSMSVNAASTITVSYKLSINDYTPSTNAKIVGKVTDATNNTVKTTVESSLTKSEDGTYYVFEIPVAPAEITCPITLQLVDGDSTWTPVNGKTLNDYLKYLETSGTTAQINLAKSLRNYGGYAQTYFGVNTNTLANASLSNAPELPSSIDYALTSTGTITGFSFTTLNLVAEADTTLQVKFSIAEGSSIDDYSFALSYVDDEGVRRYFDVNDRVVNGSYVEIPNMAGALLTRKYTLTCTYTPTSADGETDETSATSESATLEFSATDYMSLVLSSSSTSTAQKNLVKAMYAYAQAANTYFFGEGV